jgi:hypothetical protein
MIKMRVGDALAIAECECFVFGCGQNLREFDVAQLRKARPHDVVGRVGIGHGPPVAVGDVKEPLQELRSIGTTSDRQKINDLNEQARMACTCLAHGLHQAAQSGNVAVMADTQQGSARYVANPGRLDHDGAGPAARKALIPRDHLVGHKAVLGRPPWHHCGHPRTLFEHDGTDPNGSEQARYRRLLA